MGWKSQGRGDAKNGPRWIWFEELDEIRKEVELVMGNETLEHVCSSMHDGDWGCDRCGDNCDCPNAESIISSFADRILSAHNREMAAKDAEIRELTKELLKKYAKDGVPLEAHNADMAASNREIMSLRALVKELADALLVMNNLVCLVCASRHKTDCMKGDYCDRKIGNNELVAKARKEVGA